MPSEPVAVRLSAQLCTRLAVQLDRVHELLPIGQRLPDRLRCRHGAVQQVLIGRPYLHSDLGHLLLESSCPSSVDRFRYRQAAFSSPACTCALCSAVSPPGVRCSTCQAKIVA